MHGRIETIDDILAIKGREVISIGADTPVAEAARMMHIKTIGILIVLDENKKFVGVLSERDIVATVARNPTQLTTLMARDINTSNIIACEPHANPKEVIKIMQEKGFRHMPVVHEGSVKGVISRTDILKRLNGG